MILFWHFYWPVIAVGLLIGFFTGKRVFRPTKSDSAGANPNQRRYLTLAAGAVIAAVLAGIWHGPVGTGDRFASNVESNTRTTLGYYEMQAVNAHLESSPLRRRLILSGPSDDIQQRELKRIMDDIPGVSDVQWANPPTAPVMMK